jgi:2-methylcitrate synthase
MAQLPAKGLADVVAASTALSDIDGTAGRLFYRGYDINDLAGASTFEEISYLLQRGAPPSRGELAGYRGEIAAGRALGKLVTASLGEVARSQEPMEALRTLVSLGSADDPDKDSNDPEPNTRKAARLTAQQPLLVAAYEAARQGRETPAPDPDAGIAANFLLQVTGTAPSERAAGILDTCLVLHADHTMNASTFAARVCAATLSDMHSAIVAAIGTLKGPLHGGANEQVMLMVEKIGTPAKAEAWIRKAIADKARIMGFGHRVYRVEDPRAKHLRRLAAELGRQVGDESKVQILNTVARVVTEQKHIYPNVDLFSGAGYAAMGIPTDQFTPIFAMSRVAGWAAHVLEQHGNNRLIRPRAEYTGLTRATYVPISQR